MPAACRSGSSSWAARRPTKPWWRCWPHSRLTRGPLPRAERVPARAELAALDIARQNELRLRLGWSAFRSRRGKDIGALTPDKFRELTDELVKAAVAGQ